MEVGGGGLEGGFPVAISSCDVVDVTVSFLQLMKPITKIMHEVVINLVIVLVFVDNEKVSGVILK
jgi:hypothetical protein